MKKSFLILAVTLVMILMLTACSGDTGTDDYVADTQIENQTDIQKENETKEEAAGMGSEKRVAKDGAVMQTEDPAMPTRVIENGTKVYIHFGDTVIPGILNDSDTAKALIEMLPYTVHMNSYSHDFCGIMPDELPYNEDEVHYGWLNGDIDYAIDAPYFTILHSDEEISEQYGYQVNIGVVDCELSRIRDLSGSYDVLIELADETETEPEEELKVKEEIGEQTEMKMNVQIGDYSFTAALENNAAVEELLDMMKEGSITIQMDDYSGFEKVGPLGRSLTTSNSQTTTSAGDIVLYNGNNIVMFYGSNSWNYTRIGKIEDLSDWEKALGGGSITAVFTLAE